MTNIKTAHSVDLGGWQSQYEKLRLNILGRMFTRLKRPFVRGNYIDITKLPRHTILCGCNKCVPSMTRNIRQTAQLRKDK